MTGADSTERELIDFVVREARLLDDKRYAEWLEDTLVRLLLVSPGC